MEAVRGAICMEADHAGRNKARPSRKILENGHTGGREYGEIYLCINREGRLPVLRRDDSTDSIFPSFRRNLLDVRHGILEFLLGWPKCRGLGQTMRAHALGGLTRSIGLTAALNRGEI